MRSLNKREFIRVFSFGLMVLLLTLTYSTRGQCKGLNLLDDYSVDSRTDYVTNIKTGVFDLPVTNWRIKENRLYPAPEEREDYWKNNPNTKRSACVYRKNERLSPDQGMAITLGYPTSAWKYEKCGLVVENVLFTITPGAAGYYLSVQGKEYDLLLKKLKGENVTLTLVRGGPGSEDVIFWYAEGGGVSQRGQVEISNLPREARFGFVFGMGYNDTQRNVYLCDFRYGPMKSNELPSVPTAGLTIRAKLPPVYHNSIKPLVENREGPLTSKEMDKLVEWALNEPGQWSNYENRALYHHVKLFRVYRIYERTKDLRVLDHLVKIAEMALESRNDLNKVVGPYQILTGWKEEKWTAEILPTWPHLMGWKTQDGERYYYGDVGEDAVGVHYLALAARAIAETPGIWNDTIKGTSWTYLDRAKNYINEAIYTVEKSIVPLYIEPGSCEFIYQTRRGIKGTQTLDKGGYIPFNRCWHVPVAFVSLCPAMEALKIEPDKVKFYDKITQVSIDRWLTSMRHYRKNGHDLIDYPYCYPSQHIYKANPEKWHFMPSHFNGFPSEDLGHLGCDASQLYVFHFSKRYTLPVDILKKYANALLVNAPKENGYMAYRLNGDGSPGAKTLSAEAYFLTLFQSQLKSLYWDNPHQNKELLDWEVLFLKFFKHAE